RDQGFYHGVSNLLLQFAGIFCPTRRLDRVHVDKFLDIMQLRRWESLLSEGQGQSASDEVCGYLDLIAKREAVNQEVLHSFWIQFQQAVLNAARSLNLNPHEIVSLLEEGAKAQSLQEVKTAIKALVKCFPSTDMPVGHAKRVVEQVSKYVEDHMNQPLSIADIATHFFLNPDYLSRMFKNETGLPLKEYIISRKMESARTLLRTTQLPVNVIASKLGYDNYSYFSQVYRKMMGISPKDERKEETP
ncbi:MAG: helix-turn-helix transcriptional regulator, partial [Neglectibacter timonensis]